jgi:hypothetical protein
VRELGGASPNNGATPFILGVRGTEELKYLSAVLRLLLQFNVLPMTLLAGAVTNGAYGHKWCQRSEYVLRCSFSMPPSAINFFFKDGSKWLKDGKGFAAFLAIYGVPKGISKVEQLVGTKWTPVSCAPSFRTTGQHLVSYLAWIQKLGPPKTISEAANCPGLPAVHFAL